MSALIASQFKVAGPRCYAPDPHFRFTHLTHGCITLFRHFSRVRSDYTAASLAQSDGFLRLFEAAHRTLFGREYGGRKSGQPPVQNPSPLPHATGTTAPHESEADPN